MYVCYNACGVMLPLCLLRELVGCFGFVFWAAIETLFGCWCFVALQVCVTLLVCCYYCVLGVFIVGF